MTASISAAGISSSTGIGWATTRPEVRPSDHAASMVRAISSGPSARSGAGKPLLRE